MFKVSRNEKNDPAFLEGNILGKIMILKFFLWIYIVQKDFFFSDIKHHIRLELVITYKNHKDRPEKIESNRNIIPHLRLQTKAQMSQCNLITTPAYMHTPPWIDTHAHLMNDFLNLWAHMWMTDALCNIMLWQLYPYTCFITFLSSWVEQNC